VFSFIETKLFTRLVQDYLSDDEYRELQKALMADPEAGDVIPGTGGSARFDGRHRAAGNAADIASSTSPGSNGA
jgi:hypothetical protein